MTWLTMVATGLTTLSAHLGALLTFAQWPAVNSAAKYLYKPPGGPSMPAS